MSGTAQPKVVLAVCCMSVLIVWMDNTAVNVALPSIGRDLHASVAGLQWVVDAYTVGLASLLIMSGSLADRLGRRRIFGTGLVLFGLGSFACGVAPQLGCLVGSRVLLAVGGSMLNPAAIAIVRTSFIDEAARARAFGALGATLGIGLALGPVIGGALIEAMGWRAVFWTTVPVCLAALALTAAFVPESKVARPRRMDPVGNVLLIATLASVTFAIIEGSAQGWLSVEVLTAAAAAIAFLGALLAQERTRVEPLLELRFFRSASFSGAALLAISAYAALGGFLFLNTLLLQDLRNVSPAAAGRYILPIALMTIVLSPLSGHVVARHGPRMSLVASGCGLTVGGALLTNASAATPSGFLVFAYVVFGIGFGMVNPPITTTALAGMPASQAGTAGAITAAARQVGLLLGVALVGAMRGGGWWVIVAFGAAVTLLGLTIAGRP
jgi:EmrB/QacA subfamily drug resistance transporter